MPNSAKNNVTGSSKRVAKLRVEPYQNRILAIFLDPIREGPGFLATCAGTWGSQKPKKTFVVVGFSILRMAYGWGVGRTSQPRWKT